MCVHRQGTSSRIRIFHRSVVSATHDQRCTAISRTLSRLIEEDRSGIRRYNTTTNTIRNVFRYKNLTLIGLDFAKFWKQFTSESICRNNDATGN